MISAIVPARNEEASIARLLHSLALQPEIGEIIVVDDQSTDGTSAILAELSRHIPHLKIVQAGPLPLGWTGKNRAVSLGAQAARGDWLLFTDADTCHLPGSAAHALAAAERRHAALVSYSPQQQMQTLWDKALIPFVYWRLSQRYPFNRINNPALPDAAANGQYILMRREAYESIGGHAAIPTEILEDVALARRAKQAGWTIFFDSGAGIVETRMYRSFSAMWQGWTKNLSLLFGPGLGEILLEIDVATPWLAFVLAAVVAVEWAARGRFDWLVALLAAVFFIRPWAWYESWLLRNRYPAACIKCYPIASALYSAALLVSWWKTAHGAVAWKGRQYVRQRPARG